MLRWPPAGEELLGHGVALRGLRAGGDGRPVLRPCQRSSVLISL